MNLKCLSSKVKQYNKCIEIFTNMIKSWKKKSKGVLRIQFRIMVHSEREGERCEDQDAGIVLFGKLSLWVYGCFSSNYLKLHVCIISTFLHIYDIYKCFKGQKRVKQGKKII